MICPTQSEVLELLPYLTRPERDEMDSLLRSIEEDHAEERARCAADIVHWLNTYGWTYDPRLLPADPFIPFKPYPRQVEFLRWLEEREAKQEGGLAEKSRDVGFTWLCCAYAVHGFLFRPGFAAGFGSRKLELVDRIGDPSCIFEKMRMLLRRVPPWQLPHGFKWDEHANHCRILNPESGASVTGEGGDNIGRGGRTTLYFIDEAAFLEHAQSVEASLSQTTRVPIWVSTPNGQGNPFATKRHGGQVPVFTFHWKDDPRKGEAWYAEQRRLLDPVTVAQELDIDYTASIEGICIPARWVRAAVGLELPASESCVAALDVAEEGRNRNVYLCRRGPVVSRVFDWGQCNTTETAHRAREEAEKDHATILHFDCIGVGAGVKGTLESMERTLPFQVSPINVGHPPSVIRWENGKTSREQFINLKAELWAKMRLRFERTFEYVESGVQRDPSELISIPNHPALIAQLSSVLWFRTETGKMKMESKEQLARRGVASPDFAEALMLSEAHSTGKWTMS